MIARMKHSSCSFTLLFLLASTFSQQMSLAEGQQLAGADQKAGSSKTKKSKSGAEKKAGSEATAAPAVQDAALETAFSQMDAAASTFRSAEAELMQEDYQKVVDDHHKENGKIYFRKTSKGLQMAMDFTNSPDSKYVVLSDNKVRLYQPRIDQVTEYTINNNSADVESMFALGFGGRGHDLLKSFDVKLVGSEMMDGDQVNRLELIPKTQGIKRYFSRIELWFAPERKVPLQQQFWQPSGDYHLAHYSNIKLNPRLPDDVFKLKTTRHTKVVRP